MLINPLHEKIQVAHLKRKRARIYRHRHLAEIQKQNCIQIKGKTAINFAGNDYLGLTQHPEITHIFVQAAKRYGVGSGASPLITGYSVAQAETEKKFAEWLQVDSAILFSSGYAANTGVIPTLADRKSTVFSDKLCHASLLDGIFLSRAKHLRYKHNDPLDLARLSTKHRPQLIVTESVFSMEGNLTDLSSLVHLAKKNQSALLIDDAHGIGVIGPHGKGACDAFHLTQDDYSCLVLPLGKAFNTMGAIVAGRHQIIEHILQFARSYIYSTAISPALCLAIQATLKIIQTETWRQKSLQQNIKIFIQYALEHGLAISWSSPTPVKTLKVEDNSKLLRLQDFLLSKGFYVAAIRPPTVPENKARLRISLNALHTETEIMSLIETIKTGLQSC